MKRIKYLLIPVLVISLIIPIVSSGSERHCKRDMVNKDINLLRHKYDSVLKDRGGIFKDYIADKGDLIILGSSELSSDVDQNPVNVFPFDGAEYDVSIFGRAYIQSLQHSAIIGSTKTADKNKKIVLIVSLQWFTDREGIDDFDYRTNFSEYQFYKIFSNKNISHENKVYYAQRNSRLLKGESRYIEERLYARLYAADSVLSKAALGLLNPYYKFKEYLLGIKDKAQTEKALMSLPDHPNSEKVNKLIWKDEYDKAEAQGLAAATNNPLNVDDNYYDTYLRDKYDSLKDQSRDVELLESKELEDYEYFLKLSKDIGIKPLLILMPVHGDYYDYLGVSKDKRTEYYDTLQGLAEEYGFHVLNLQDKEYEKYYLIDVMHLGWKGWLNVDEEIYKYYGR